MKHPKGESHRIYWQQWLTPSPSSAGGPQSRRELITSSAAIRISPDTARARDVTKLLRDTLNLSSLSNGHDNSSNENAIDEEFTAGRFCDSLVLVGTLYSLPPDYIQFEHEPPPIVKRTAQSEMLSSQKSSTVPALPNGHATTATKNDSSKQPAYYYSSSQTSEPFHVVKTLAPDDNPLKLRDVMMEHLRRIQASTAKISNKEYNSGASSSLPLISPKIQWYFVPGTSEKSSPIPNCIDLDGYCTSMENDDGEDCDSSSHDIYDEDENDSCGNGANDGLVWDDSSPNYDLLLSRCPLANSSSSPWKLFSSAKGSMDSTISAPTSPLKDSSDSKISIPPTSPRQISAENRERRRQRRELRRYTQLSQCRSSSNHCISGYLLKQSNRDPHVWRRVHCVLTEDSLWHVTRVSTYRHEKVGHTREAVTQTLQFVQRNQPRFRMARRHGRIDLVRALLLEPNTTEYSPLYRTPYSFEVVSATGTNHVFRAGNRSEQLQWVQALSARIAQRQENDLMAHAELIVADECIARNKRLVSVAVQPLWSSFQKQLVVNQQTQNPQPPSSSVEPDGTGSGTAATSAFTAIPPSISSSSLASRSTASYSVEGSSTTKSTSIGDDVDTATHSDEYNMMKQVLRFGMEVAEYRERCRHVQAILPAKKPIVVISDSPLTRNTSSSSVDRLHPENHSHGSHRDTVEPEPLDAETKAMVRSTWVAASSLLARATQVAMDIQVSVATTNGSSSSSTSPIVSGKEGKRLSRSLETLCRHIDYVITGEHRPLSGRAGGGGVFFRSNTSDTKSDQNNNHLRLPPPPSIPSTQPIKSATSSQKSNSMSSISGDPPPVDLFDLLLAELQHVAATSAGYHRRRLLDQDI